jgi:hypothetical protein
VEDNRHLISEPAQIGPRDTQTNLQNIASDGYDSFAKISVNCVQPIKELGKKPRKNGLGLSYTIIEVIFKES